MGSSNSKRFMAFIDGFNLYHYINDNADLRQYKWLNLRSLCEKFLPPNSFLGRVIYCSAYSWVPEKELRHSLYVKVLNTVGIEDKMGNFKNETDTINIKRGLKLIYTHKKEKKTDVRLASEMVLAATRDEFDIAFLITSDSDFIPAVQLVQEECSPKKVWLLRSNKRTTELQDNVDKHFKIRKANLRDSQFTDEVELHSGTIVHKPESW